METYRKQDDASRFDILRPKPRTKLRGDTRSKAVTHDEDIFGFSTMFHQPVPSGPSICREAYFRRTGSTISEAPVVNCKNVGVQSRGEGFINGYPDLEGACCSISVEEKYGWTCLKGRFDVGSYVLWNGGQGSVVLVIEKEPCSD